MITGGSGLLALNWFAAMRSRYDVILGIHKRKPRLAGATGLKLDLESVGSLEAVLRTYTPVLVVHAAGCTSVEACEANPVQAHHVNVVLSSNVAQACQRAKIPLAYISTDHLFAGASAMSSETEPVTPINEYAKTKAAAEQLVAEACPEALLIRTNFYGWGTNYRQSFSDFIINSLRQGSPISLFDDVHYTPIVVERLAEVVHILAARKASGVYNVVGSERITKYDFGQHLAKVFELDTSLIQRGRLSELSALVSRPRDMSLSNNKVCKLIKHDLGTIDEHLQLLLHQERSGLALEFGKL